MLLYTTSFEFYDLAIFMKVGKFPTINKEIKYKQNYYLQDLKFRYLKINPFMPEAVTI